eukprot:Phypoly_transcript_05655.p1 GENE.Phypoly_transcript_05655~~Phypoly_transcript_05655.p1  ORF type:complete len:593 (+),score=98.16 Phypoly_transcript_05655:61-1839(+)
MKTVTLLVAFVAIVLVYAKEEELPLDLDILDILNNQWDFIVVGAGASGSVVASRLSAETNQKILLLEGGALGTGQRDVGGDDFVASYFTTDPITGKQKRGPPVTRYDVPLMLDTIRSASNVLDNVWNITAIGAPFATQAKVVGGNQATNGMAWIPPTKADFDGWGLADYTAANMWQYMKRIENATETGFGTSPDRGNSGRTNIKFASFVAQEQIRFQNASVLAGYSLGGDLNSGTIEAKVYLNQNNIKNGIRQSSSLTYLAPVLKNLTSNLTFRTSAVVTEVLFDSSNNATGVKYYDETANCYKKVYARKEVILAVGDLHTAKLLFNSGIGPLSILNAFGKPNRVVNEMIGQKIRNHQRVAMVYNDPSIINANLYNYPAASLQYAGNGTGIIEGRGLTYLNINTSFGDPQPYPDIQAIPGSVAGATPTSVYAQGLGISISLNRNLAANGTVNLTSSDPLAGIVFTPNYFLVQDDVERMARGIIEVRRVMDSWNLLNGSAVEVTPGPAYQTVEDLITWIRTVGANGNCHFHGSAPMGTDPAFPTAPDMLVKGVQKLRIVGPALVPNIVYPGMQALAVAFGEKATDLIKTKYNL